MTAFYLHNSDSTRASILANCLAFLAQLPDSKSWVVEIRKYVKTRTLAQNAYLFGVGYPLLSEAKGYTVDEIHEWMCGTFFGWVDEKCPKTPQNPNGLRSKPFRTTTRDENGKRDVIGREPFGRFVDTMQRIAAQAGVFIPDPEPELIRQIEAKP